MFARFFGFIDLLPLIVMVLERSDLTFGTEVETGINDFDGDFLIRCCFGE